MTYQVRRLIIGCDTDSTIATSVTLEAAVEIAFRLTRMQEQLGGDDEFTILPD